MWLIKPILFEYKPGGVYIENSEINANVIDTHFSMIYGTEKNHESAVDSKRDKKIKRYRQMNIYHEK